MEQIPAEQNYDDWVDAMYVSDTKTRVRAIEETLGEFARKSEEAKKLADSLIDTKEFEKPILLAFVHYTANSAQNPGTLSHLKFPELVVGLKHKKLPLILAVSTKIPNPSSIKINRIKTSMGVPQALAFTDTLSRMSWTDKSKLFSMIVDGIKTYRSGNSGGKEWLSDYLDSNKDFKFMGFAANLPYLNVNPKTGDTKNFWVHAWGTPQLLFSHNRLPAIMIVGPSVRLDENVLGESDMTGFTG